jgi:hypothetical protein
MAGDIITGKTAVSSETRSCSAVAMLAELANLIGWEWDNLSVYRIIYFYFFKTFLDCDFKKPIIRGK